MGYCCIGCNASLTVADMPVTVFVVTIIFTAEVVIHGFAGSYFDCINRTEMPVVHINLIFALCKNHIRDLLSILGPQGYGATLCRDKLILVIVVGHLNLVVNGRKGLADHKFPACRFCANAGDFLIGNDILSRPYTCALGGKLILFNNAVSAHRIIMGGPLLCTVGSSKIDGNFVLANFNKHVHVLHSMAVPVTAHNIPTINIAQKFPIHTVGGAQQNQPTPGIICPEGGGNIIIRHHVIGSWIVGILVDTEAVLIAGNVGQCIIAYPCLTAIIGQRIPDGFAGVEARILNQGVTGDCISRTLNDNSFSKNLEIVRLL